ncbi:type VII secretion integral membrane protein EccD, partial [Catenulispora subtropica]|uniref:type VII secretion integral membrane protein EccD n=1 Tax=Catenulispora subtropica TaxID=450798 RepID=UPI0031D4D408
RVAHDRRAALACDAAGVPAAVAAGLAALPPHHLWPVHGGAAALGLGVTGAYGGLAMIAVRRWSAWFGALAAFCAFGAATAAVVGLAEVTAAHAGVVLAVLATALAATAPMIAMRLGRLPLPRVPSDITAFRADEEPTLGPDVLGQTTAAQRMLTGLLAALGLSVVAGSVAALRADGAWPVVLVTLLSMVWMLRSRSYSDTVQRVVLVGTGLASLAWLAVVLVTRQEKALLVSGVVVLALAGFGCFVYARHAGQGRHSPYWTRLMDLAEFLGVVALLPIAGVALGVYEHLGHIKN